MTTLTQPIFWRWYFRDDLRSKVGFCAA